MSKKNETITQTVVRYGKAYLTQGGIFGLGKEALSDYLDSSEDKELLESLKASYDDWEYEEVVDKCDMALIKNDLAYFIYQCLFPCSIIPSIEMKYSFLNNRAIMGKVYFLYQTEVHSLDHLF